MRLLILLGACILVLLPSLVMADATPTTSTLLPLTNATRAANGVSGLVDLWGLDNLAMQRAHYLVARSTPGADALSHCVNVTEGGPPCPSGNSYVQIAQNDGLLSQAGWVIGENLGLFHSFVPVTLNDPKLREFMQSLWVASPDHLTNMIDPRFHWYGSAELRMPSGAIIYVTEFAH
jgi:uncharacterized protein YkwD